jgi:hypothetical protein
MLQWKNVCKKGRFFWNDFFSFAIEALLWYGFLRSSGGGERAQGVN